MINSSDLSVCLQLRARKSSRMIVVMFVVVRCLLALPLSAAFCLTVPSHEPLVQLGMNYKSGPETAHPSSASLAAPIDSWHGRKYNVSIWKSQFC